MGTKGQAGGKRPPAPAHRMKSRISRSPGCCSQSSMWRRMMPSWRRAEWGDGGLLLLFQGGLFFRMRAGGWV